MMAECGCVPPSLYRDAGVWAGVLEDPASSAGGDLLRTLTASPLWRVLLQHPHICGSADGADTREYVARTLRHFGKLSANLPVVDERTPQDDTLLCVELRVSLLPIRVRLSTRLAWAVHIPLLELIRLSAEQWRAHHCGARRLLVGIAGGAASGKSVLSRMLEFLARGWPPLAHPPGSGAIGSGATPHATVVPPLAVLSMDAYHRRNADLEAAGLRRVKGRIDTFDADAFAADLEKLQWVHDDDPSPILIPEYDRLIQHDPIPAHAAVHHDTRIVLVEGLYLCRAGSAASCAGPATPPAWMRVRACLQWSLLLLPQDVDCVRTRAVERKAGGGMPMRAAEEHFDRVDSPVHGAVAEDAAKPCSRFLLDMLHPHLSPHTGSGCVSVEGDALSVAESAPIAAGPELVALVGDDWHWSYALLNAPRAAPVRILTAASLPLSHAPSLSAPVSVPAPAAPTRASAPVASTVFVGLSPCVQRTLVFRDGWTRGNTNRATAHTCTAGGKAQNAAVAAVRTAAMHARRPDILAATRTVLLQSLAGLAGTLIATLLQEATAKAVRAGTGCVEEVDPGAAIAAVPHATLPTVLFEQINVWPEGAGDAAATVALADSSLCSRTCTSLVDDMRGEVTEMIEPAPPLSPLALAAVQACAQRLLMEPSLQRGVWVFSGSLPAGSAHLATSLLQSINDARTSGTRVIVDAVDNLLPRMRLGGVDVLKLNAEEVRVCAQAAVRELPSSHATLLSHAHAARRHIHLRHPEMLEYALTLLLWQHVVLSSAAQAGERTSDGCYAVGITKGDQPACLVIRVPHPCGGARVEVFEYLNCSLPRGTLAVNAIGAGDTCTGTLASLLSVSGAQRREWLALLPAAFGLALAAASASVATYTPADWDATTASQVFDGMAFRSFVLEMSV